MTRAELFRITPVDCQGELKQETGQIVNSDPPQFFCRKWILCKAPKEVCALKYLNGEGTGASDESAELAVSDVQYRFDRCTGYSVIQKEQE